MLTERAVLAENHTVCTIGSLGGEEAPEHLPPERVKTHDYKYTQSTVVVWDVLSPIWLGCAG